VAHRPHLLDARLLLFHFVLAVHRRQRREEPRRVWIIAHQGAQPDHL
jgi:hypothetical protein